MGMRDEILEQPEAVGRLIERRSVKAAALAASFGAENLVVGGGAKRSTGTTDEDLERLAESLNRVVDVVGRHGLTLTGGVPGATLADESQSHHRFTAFSLDRWCFRAPRQARARRQDPDLRYTTGPVRSQPRGRGLVPHTEVRSGD